MYGDKLVEKKSEWKPPSYYKEVSKGVCKPSDYAVVRGGNVYVIDLTSKEYQEKLAAKKAKKAKKVADKLAKIEARAKRRAEKVALKEVKKAQKEAKKQARVAKLAAKLADLQKK